MSGTVPRISIIITCYNYAKFVGTAIDSVLAQAYSEKELIVVDDASFDASPDIISSYYDRLLPVLKTRNGGHGAAFNSGFEASSGEIILFLDADDFLYPDSLNQIAADFDPNISMRQYRMNLVDGDGEAYDIFPKFEQNFLSGNQKERVLRTGRIVTTVTSGLVFSRQFLDQVMPMPPEDFRQGGDGYLTALAPMYGDLADGRQHVAAGYRQHGENHSGFGAKIEKRAQWCVRHDEARYRIQRQHAGKLGLSLMEPLGWRDEGHLTQKMALVLFGIHPEPRPSRPILSVAAVKCLTDVPMSWANRVIIILWWLTISILPRGRAKTLFAWRFHSSSRPKWMKKLASTLRKI